MSIDTYHFLAAVAGATAAAFDGETTDVASDTTAMANAAMKLSGAWMIANFTCLFALPARARDLDDVPNPRQTHWGWVTDETKVLGAAAESIERRLEALHKETGAEVAWVVLRTIGEQLRIGLRRSCCYGRAPEAAARVEAAQALRTEGERREESLLRSAPRAGMLGWSHEHAQS